MNTMHKEWLHHQVTYHANPVIKLNFTIICIYMKWLCIIFKVHVRHILTHIMKVAPV